jgi:hypothetical protein
MDGEAVTQFKLCCWNWTSIRSLLMVKLMVKEISNSYSSASAFSVSTSRLADGV